MATLQARLPVMPRVTDGLTPNQIALFQAGISAERVRVLRSSAIFQAAQGNRRAAALTLWNAVVEARRVRKLIRKATVRPTTMTGLRAELLRAAE